MAKSFDIKDFLDSINYVDMEELIKKFDNRVQTYPILSNFPTTGEENTLYIDTSTNTIYRWDDTDIKYYRLGTDSGGMNIQFIDGSF